MGNTTTISWTDATFNPWWGCTKVSRACDNCYAETIAKRFHPEQALWGHDDRRIFGEKHWAEPLRWARTLPAKLGRRPRIFCASMADVFDNHPAVAAEREKLWALIEKTPELDWQLLTKRIGNVARMVPGSWLRGWPAHAWIGISVVTQEEVDRDVPRLLQLPVGVRFLSCEPLLERLNITEVLLRFRSVHDGKVDFGYVHPLEGPCGIDWVIAGGESGRRGARPAHPDWFRSLRDQCAAAGVPFHFKQWGEWAPGANFESIPSGTYCDFDGTLKHDDDRVWKVGNKAAGRLLDGVEHNEFPA